MADFTMLRRGSPRAHRVNRQTHRGQAHASSTGLPGGAAELDFLFFRRLPARPAA
jgi:hypothetical protein